MHKHHGDHGRGKKSFESTGRDADWERPRSKHGRSKTRRIRHKPYEWHSWTKRFDWDEDADSDYF